MFKTNSEQEFDTEESNEELKEVHIKLTTVCKPAVQMNIADTKGKLYANVSFKDQVQQGQH